MENGKDTQQQPVLRSLQQLYLQGKHEREVAELQRQLQRLQQRQAAEAELAEAQQVAVQWLAQQHQLRVPEKMLQVKEYPHSAGWYGLLVQLGQGAWIKPRGWLLAPQARGNSSGGWAWKPEEGKAWRYTNGRQTPTTDDLAEAVYHATQLARRQQDGAA